MSDSFHILLVEDDTAGVMMFQRAFDRAMADGEKWTGDLEPALHVARDGEEALAYLYGTGGHARIAPHLVLLDLNMPRTDGYEVLKRIRADEELQELPVVVFTTSTAPSDIAWCYRHGANAYVPKAMSYKAFRDDVRSILHFWCGVALNPRRRVPHSGRPSAGVGNG